MSNDALVKEYFTKVQKRTFLVLKNILEDVDTDTEVEEIDDKLFDSFKPRKFSGADGFEVKHTKSFNDSCTLIQQHVHQDARSMTVLEYYQVLEFIKEQLKKKQKSKSRRK